MKACLLIPLLLLPVVAALVLAVVSLLLAAMGLLHPVAIQGLHSTLTILK
jgi:hypothetical protein